MIFFSQAVFSPVFFFFFLNMHCYPFKANVPSIYLFPAHKASNFMLIPSVKKIRHLA